MGTTPICDAGTNSCVGCSSHEQCPATACNFVAGNCVDSSNVVYVDGDEDCGVGDGTEEMPYCDMAEATGAAGSELLVILGERAGQASYEEATTIGNYVVVFAAESEAPILRGFNSQPAATVTPAGALYLRGVTVSGGPAAGLQVNNGQLWLEETVVDGNTDAGVSVNGGEAEIWRSRVVNNSGGGIVVEGGGTVRVENSFVGSDDSSVIAVRVNEGELAMNYTTVVSDFGTSAALSCTDNGTVEIRNSLLASQSADDELQCAAATVETSALEMPIEGNTMLPAFDINWFVSYADGNFSLQMDMYPEPLETAAAWREGDPATDINGDPRPTSDGEPDFAGADRIP